MHRNVSALKRILASAGLVCLATACAGNPASNVALEAEIPWWESAGPCRIWMPNTPAPGQMATWRPSASTTRMSASGDCRTLQAALPDGALLIGTP